MPSDEYSEAWAVDGVTIPYSHTKILEKKKRDNERVLIVKDKKEEVLASLIFVVHDAMVSGWRGGRGGSDVLTSTAGTTSIRELDWLSADRGFSFDIVLKCVKFDINNFLFYP